MFTENRCAEVITILIARAVVNQPIIKPVSLFTLIYWSSKGSLLSLHQYHCLPWYTGLLKVHYCRLLLSPPAELPLEVHMEHTRAPPHGRTVKLSGRFDEPCDGPVYRIMFS